MPNSIRRGRPLAFVDAVGNFVAIPQKLLFLTADLDSHYIDEEVEEAVVRFLDTHEIEGVCVRLNEWDPLGELFRLFSNKRVSLLWRLLMGLPLWWFGYVLNIGRIWGGDYYNPYSDTVNLFSNHRAIALHELGHVLDFRRRSYPGLYAMIRMLPFVALFQEFKASVYAIEFFRDAKEHEAEIRAYRILYPAYSTYLFGSIVEMVPSPIVTLFFFPVIGVGHVLGHFHAMSRLVVLRRDEGVSITLGSLLGKEWRRSTELLAPNSRLGCGIWGAGLGLLLGLFLCQPLFVGVSFLGFAVGRVVGARLAPKKEERVLLNDGGPEQVG